MSPLSRGARSDGLVGFQLWQMREKAVVKKFQWIQHFLCGHHSVGTSCLCTLRGETLSSAARCNSEGTFSTSTCLINACLLYFEVHSWHIRFASNVLCMKTIQASGHAVSRCNLCCAHVFRCNFHWGWKKGKNMTKVYKSSPCLYFCCIVA